MTVSPRMFRRIVRAIGVLWLLVGLYVGSSVFLIPYERKVHAMFAAAFLLMGLWLLCFRNPFNLFGSKPESGDGAPGAPTMNSSEPGEPAPSPPPESSLRIEHGSMLFETRSVVDNVDGYCAVDLFDIRDGRDQRVARVTFWDAMGQFTVETCDNAEVPLAVFEKLVAEAKRVNHMD